MGKLIQAFEVDNALLGKAIHTGQSNITQNGKVQNQALALTVFSNEANACLDSILGLINMQILALKGNFTALAVIHAKNSAHDFRATGTHKSGHA